jgi:competence protein ComEC
MKQKILKRFFTVIIAVLSFVFIAGCSLPASSSNVANESAKIAEGSENNSSPSNASSVNGKLKVHYINVGQGDSILVQQGDKNMLIDAGTNASASSLISYLRSQNIKKLDYLVLTHPHEDHIGGADAVIKTFEIGSIYMPKVTANTATFRDVVKAMNAKGLKAASPVPGTNFNLGQAVCDILGPVNTVSGDLNTYSIVIKVNFGNNKFLFTGDAQASNEKDMVNKDFDLSADVLKLGHHGSHTSTSQNFLNKVNPEYAVISCGVANDYGHPHKETMDRLKRMNITVYRTDESGTIVAESDGKNISFNVKPGDYRYGSQVKK